MDDVSALQSAAQPLRDRNNQILQHPSVREGLPATERGRKTRSALIDGAKVVFSRDGYIGARLTDITAEAGCSTGTFYTHFSGKEEIMAAVINDVFSEMISPPMRRLEDVESDPIRVIRTGHAAYFEAYKRNAQFMVAFEQASTIDPDFAKMRVARGDLFGRRNARWIGEFQGRGLVNPELDPWLIALALNAMVSRLAYRAIALASDIDLDQLLDVVTELWASALGLTGPEGQVRV